MGACAALGLALPASAEDPKPTLRVHRSETVLSTDPIKLRFDWPKGTVRRVALGTPLDSHAVFRLSVFPLSRTVRMVAEPEVFAQLTAAHSLLGHLFGEGTEAPSRLSPWRLRLDESGRAVDVQVSPGVQAFRDSLQESDPSESSSTPKSRLDPALRPVAEELAKALVAALAGLVPPGTEVPALLLLALWNHLFVGWHGLELAPGESTTVAWSPLLDPKTTPTEQPASVHFESWQPCWQHLVEPQCARIRRTLDDLEIADPAFPPPEELQQALCPDSLPATWADLRVPLQQTLIVQPDGFHPVELAEQRRLTGRIRCADGTLSERRSHEGEFTLDFAL